MVVCLTSIRFNMKADILRPVSIDNTNIIDASGEYQFIQNPDNGEFVRQWVPIVEGQQGATADDVIKSSFACVARGITTSSIRATGAGERWGDLYEGTDYVIINFGAGVDLSRRDRVTNIRDRSNNVIWVENEVYRDDGTHPPTVFEVTGVIPIPDPWGRHIENQALLSRVQNQ